MKNLYVTLLVFTFFSTSCSKEDPVKTTKQGAFFTETITTSGCLGASYDHWKTSDFVLPYPVGETYAVNLSHCSGSYHSAGQPDQFAIDFAMSIGSTITAAREGKVVHIEDSGYDFSFPNNLVIVQHSDGTYGQYMHLTHDGASVKIGNNVIKGQAIGLSGSTGLAGYPHLHFVVTKSGAWEYPYISVPRTFRNTAPNKFSLKMGQSYQALPYE